MIYEPPVKGLFMVMVTSAIIVSVGIGLIIYGMLIGENFKYELKRLIDNYGDIELGFIPTVNFMPLINTIEFSSKIRGIGIGLTVAGSVINLISWYYRRLLKKKILNMLRRFGENAKH